MEIKMSTFLKSKKKFKNKLARNFPEIVILLFKLKSNMRCISGLNVELLQKCRFRADIRVYVAKHVWSTRNGCGTYV